MNPLQVTPTPIDGLVVLHVKRVHEGRGEIRELYRASAYCDIGIGVSSWAQVNLTRTVYGAVRGLHAENMCKLVTVAHGEVFGVYVDVREQSPTFGNVFYRSIVPGVQVFVPRGVCNGFQVVSQEGAEYLYMFDIEWKSGMPGRALTPLDESLGIPWPIPIDPLNRTQISEKDAAAPTLQDLHSELSK